MKVKYFSLTGSFEGGMKIRGRWVYVTDLSHVDKTGWERIMTGDMTPAMAGCLKCASITAGTAIRFYEHGPISPEFPNQFSGTASGPIPTVSAAGAGGLI
jgi:hypothetical protein